MTKENKQYLLVGTFLVVTLILSLSVWLWFSSNNRQSYNTYLTIFHESVDGLSINSAVKYNGIDVGKVKKILLGQNPRDILIYLDILTQINVNKKTIARLKTIGVTGITYIELTLPANANLNENIAPKNKEPYPEIQTQKSFFSSVSEQAQLLGSNVQNISSHLNLVLNDQNIEEFSQILKNVNQTTMIFASNYKEISQTLKDIAVIANNIKNSTKDLDDTMKHINELSTSLTITSNNINSLINNFSNNTLNNINSSLLPSIGSTIAEINRVSTELNQLISTLNQNPGILIHGVENKPLGPGE